MYVFVRLGQGEGVCKAGYILYVFVRLGQEEGVCV